MSYSSLTTPGVYLISDTYLCDGTGALMLLLKNLNKRVTFISDSGNYSHFNYLFKKNGIHTNYLELACNIEIGDLPLTEDPPVTWLDAPRRVPLASVLSEASKSPQPVIVIEDISTLYLELGDKECVGLVNSLRNICEILIIKCNHILLKRLWMIEINCEVVIEVSELDSGFSSEYQGRVKVTRRQNFVKTESGCYWFKVLNDAFEIIES